MRRFDGERSQEIGALCEAVRGLLAHVAGEREVRRSIESDSGYDRDLWRQLAEMGLTGISIPPVFGGLGLGPIEVEAIMEETGAALLCSPLFASSILAALIVSSAGDADTQRRILPGIADGSVIAAACLTGTGGDWTRDRVGVTASEVSGSIRLDGVADLVLHAQHADVLVVVARTGDEFRVFEVDPASGGVTITPETCLDRTLRMARVEFSSVEALRIGEGGWEEVEGALEIARLALAGEQLGGASRLLDMTVDYIANRFQFGRAVGGFQALKHMAADLVLEKEMAAVAVRNAAFSLATHSATTKADVHLAAFTCADAYSRIAADSIQMHGGIAYTDEYPAHLYLRRARVTAWLLGGPAHHRDRYLTEVGG
jgi:alkylation response protein AidB-like acyl-CoA dehydrogenase